MNRFDGVRQVQVNWWDGWFTVKKTLTDNEGCWRIDHREAGKAYMWVKFKGPRASLRGFVGNTVQLWHLFYVIVDYAGQMGGGTYNNISINYSRWVNQGSAAHRYWSAATVNNGIHEFWGQAVADGINTPHIHNDKPLDVFLAVNRRDGFTLMPNAMGPVRVGTAIATGLLTGNILFGGVGVQAGVLASLKYDDLPDLMIGCDWLNSDRLRETVYHECAHASHFGQAGPDYWMNLVIAEIAADIETGEGWGNANSNDAGRIAVCESWAEHIGYAYNHIRYGGSTSLLPTGRTWERRQEETRNDVLDHVPIGVHFDLIDPAVGYLLEDFLFYPAMALLRIDTFLAKNSSLMDFEILIDSTFNYRLWSYSDGATELVGQYSFEGGQYFLQYKLIPKQVGLFLISQAAAVYPQGEDQAFPEKCKLKGSSARVTLNGGADNNIEFLRSSPDPHYNEWILLEPEARFHKFGGYCFYVVE